MCSVVTRSSEARHVLHQNTMVKYDVRESENWKILARPAHFLQLPSHQFRRFSLENDNQTHFIVVLGRHDPDKNPEGLEGGTQDNMTIVYLLVISSLMAVLATRRPQWRWIGRSLPLLGRGSAHASQIAGQRAGRPHHPHTTTRRILSSRAVLGMLAVGLTSLLLELGVYQRHGFYLVRSPTAGVGPGASWLVYNNRTGTLVRETILRKSDYPPRPESPYEKRWPGFVLPDYYEKPFYFRRLHYDQRVCFVHVGKTAGSSLGCSLGFQLHCQKEQKHPPGLLPLYTTNLIHSDVNDCTLDMDYYLFSIRDPVERIQSWYVYEQHKLNKLRIQCGFDTLQELAERGLDRTRNDTTLECRYRARRVIRGEEKLGSHAYYNYGRYLSQVPTNASIAVIRTPHLLEDWNSMEAILGSNATVSTLRSKNRSASNKTLTNTAKDLLCFTLCTEIQVYKSLLYRAVNLNPAQIEESMQELRNQCPREADLPACPY